MKFREFSRGKLFNERGEELKNTRGEFRDKNRKCISRRDGVNNLFSAFVEAEREGKIARVYR